MNNAILFFKLKKSSYNSTNFFTDCLAEEFIKSGFNVCFFDSSSTDLSDLDKLIGKKFMAVIDFNSSLSKARIDSGEYFLDTIDAPFFNYILDHPLYHHDMLKQTLTNYHILCLDYDHAKYIKKYYPHIKSVNVLPLAGSKADFPVNYKNKKFDLLFTGTYISSNEIMTLINDLPDTVSYDIKSIIDIMLSDIKLTQEEAYSLYLGDNMKSYSATDNTLHFAASMHLLFLADTYIRAFYRERIIRTITDSNIKLTLFGQYWDKLQVKSNDNLAINQSVDFKESLNIIASSKITLNIMPWFKSGVHDRVFSSMYNNSLCLTDSSSYINSHFNDLENIVLYSLNQLESLPDIINNITTHEDLYLSICDAAYENATKNHTWKSRYDSFIDILSYI